MKFFTLSALLALALALSAQHASYFINEISYTASNPTEKGFEIAGLAGTNLNGFSVVQYDTDGWEYAVNDLSNQIIPNQQNGYGTIWYDIDQGGDTGGIALIDANGIVQQFLAFGALTDAGLLDGALDGPAAGMLPEYVGQVGSPYASLQLVGLGSLYPTFTWATSQAPSIGQVNVNQLFINGTHLQEAGNSSPDQLEAMAWPNPTTDLFRVNFPEHPSTLPRTLSLFDQQGHRLVHRTVSNDRQTVDVEVSNFPAGIYYLSVQSEANIRHCEMVIN